MHHYHMESWPDRIRRLRTRAGLSQEALAELLGIRPPSVAQWEIGRSKPSRDRLPLLAQIFETTLEEVAGKDIIIRPGLPSRREFAKDDNEVALLLFWRSLSDIKRDALFEVLEIGRPPIRKAV